MAAKNKMNEKTTEHNQTVKWTTAMVRYLTECMSKFFWFW